MLERTRPLLLQWLQFQLLPKFFQLTLLLVLHLPKFFSFCI
ncbi:D-2-hydroxyacid dehydrogenase [Listeria monocytogenes]|nr:D-2-hydroxyacid dehydrogenase [Listeria monocytogenes]